MEPSEEIFLSRLSVFENFSRPNFPPVALYRQLDRINTRTHEGPDPRASGAPIKDTDTWATIMAHRTASSGQLDQSSTILGQMVPETHQLQCVHHHVSHTCAILGVGKLRASMVNH